MNPFDEYVRNETRRQFFGQRRQRRRLRRRWRRCWATASPAPADAGATATPAPPCRLTHFAAKAKHVIYLHMVGGPSQMDLYDYKPKMSECYDKDLPDSVRKGQRLTTMTSRPGPVPDRPVEVQVRPARQERHVGQRAAAVHGARWSTTCASSASCTPRRSTTSRPSRYMQTGNQVTGRPCLGAWAQLRPRARSTRTCRRSSCWSPSRSNTGAGAGDLGPAVVVGLPVRRARRRVVPRRAATRSCTSTTRRASRPTSAARRSTA